MFPGRQAKLRWETVQEHMGAQTRVQTGLGSAPSTHQFPPYPIRIANPSPPTPAASDELNWIIDLLEKEDATSQDTFLDSCHLGKRGAPAKPFPQGAHAGAGRADSSFPSLPPLELGNPCAKDSLEDMKPPNPFLSTDFTCLPDALSPGSSDISGQCFALPLPELLWGISGELLHCQGRVCVWHQAACMGPGQGVQGGTPGEAS